MKFPAELVSRVPPLAAAGREAVATHPTGAPPRPRALRRAGATLGTDYREADEDATTAGRDPFEVDPNLVDRALRGHATTQNALANLLRSRSLAPRSPQPGEPQFDVAWLDGQVLFVVEVKSLTKRNEEQQLRLGLGQVLRYRNLLADGRRKVVAVLALERAPLMSAGSHYAGSSACDSCGPRHSRECSPRERCGLCRVKRVRPHPLPSSPCSTTRHPSSAAGAVEATRCCAWPSEAGVLTDC